MITTFSLRGHNSRVITRQRGEIPNCTPPVETRSILDEMGIDNVSTADQYCKAVADWIAGKISRDAMFQLMGAKKLMQ